IQKISRQAVLWLNAYKNTQKNLSALQKADIRLLEYEIEQFLYSYEGKSEVEILCLEKEMQTQYEGFRFKVRPDRIQKNGECIEIIDYKYRKNFKLQTNVSKMTDFALLL
ncbi:PD-(D/E)XK nuclease family protein, partial [Helicobacter japonicus]